MDRNEQEALEDYISQNNLKVTRQRRVVLKTFLGCKDHVSAEELYRAVTQKEPKIGLATVYRTLALLIQSGLASELDFGDGQKRYEQNFQNLLKQHQELKSELERINKDVSSKFGNKNNFNQKIDELNQETETLIDEIDKWQM